MALSTPNTPPGYGNAPINKARGGPGRLMTIFIPSNLRDHEPEVKRFVEAMVYKLRKNAHKGKWEGATVEDLFKLMMGEIDELKQAIDEGTSIEIALEAADIGNFAMMIAAVAIEGRTKDDR